MKEKIVVYVIYNFGLFTSICWPLLGNAQVTEGSIAAQPTMQEVVVTATKRDSTVGSTPAAITAISASEMQNNQITQVNDVAALIPNLDFGEAFGQVKLTMRGIGFSNLAMGTEGSVALNLDNVYISRPAGQAGLLFDLSQVEALRGPQGTLYGRNATGGTLNFTTAKPTPEWEGELSALGGDYAHRRFEVGVGGPIAGDTLMIRLAGLAENSSGYGKDVFTGKDVDDYGSRAARISLLYKPTTNFQNLLTVDYDRERDSSGGAHLLAAGGLTGEPGVNPIPLTGLALGGSAIFDSYDTNNDYQPSYTRKGWGIADLASLDVVGFQVKSTTGYRKLNWWLQSDLDGTTAPESFIQNGENAKQFSQELSVNTSTDRFDSTFGFYYFHESIHGRQYIPFYVGGPIGQFGQGFAGGGDQATSAYAAYGQLTFKITPVLSLTAGLRYSWEKKDESDLYTDFVNDTQFLAPYDPGSPPFEAPFRQQVHWSSTTPKFGIEYSPVKTLLLYASASKGFKAGAFNFGGTATPPGAPADPSNPPVNPESVWAYEAGIKTALADGRFNVNAAGFYYDYKDLQVSQIVDFVTLFTNAAAAKIYGTELEFQLRGTDHLNFDANLTWLHARFTDFDTADASRPGLGTLDVSGNPLAQAPDYTAHLGADYTFDMTRGKLTLRGAYDWTDRIYYDEFKRTLLSQASYGKTNAFLTYRTADGKWNISAFVKNLEGKKTYNFKYVSTVNFGYPVFGFIDPPRTYGVQVRYKF